MSQSSTYRRYCRVCWYTGRCFRIALTGSFLKAQNWGGILGIAILGFALNRYGLHVMPTDDWADTAAIALLYIVVAWVAIFLFRLVFVAPFQIHREGQWFGKKFIYKEPKLAFSTYVSVETNNQLLKFRFPDAPPFAQITYKITPERPTNFLSIWIAAHPNGMPDFTSEKDHQYTGGSLGVNRDRDVYMKTFLKSGTDPFSVRIYVHAWEELPLPREDVRRKDFEPARYG